jgi:hypothetical protein
MRAGRRQAEYHEPKGELDHPVHDRRVVRAGRRAADGNDTEGALLIDLQSKLNAAPCPVLPTVPLV